MYCQQEEQQGTRSSRVFHRKKRVTFSRHAWKWSACRQYGGGSSPNRRITIEFFIPALRLQGKGTLSRCYEKYVNSIAFFFSNERLVFSEVYLASHFIRNAIIGILQQCWWKIVVIAKIFDFYQFIWNRSWLSSVYLDKHWINCEIMRISQWRLQEVNLYSKN